MLLKVWDVRREAKRFVSASNLSILEEKGKSRYTFQGVYLAELWLWLWPSASPEIGLHIYIYIYIYRPNC